MNKYKKAIEKSQIMQDLIVDTFIWLILLCSQLQMLVTVFISVVVEVL